MNKTISTKDRVLVSAWFFAEAAGHPSMPAAINNSTKARYTTTV
jgi:hypothetical protein